MGSLRIQTFRGADFLPYLEAVAALRIEVFRSYPYLYDGSTAYEEKYLQTYLRSPHSAVVLAFDQDKVVGASTCIPMAEETEGVKQAFAGSAYPVGSTLYLGESVLQEAYRGQGAGVAFFKEREQHARHLQLKYTAFCAVIRPDDHPLKPAGYQPLDAFWVRRGYQRHPDMKARMEWKDTDQPQETTKELAFWIKEIKV